MRRTYGILHRIADLNIRTVFLAFTLSLSMLILISTYTITDGLKRGFDARTYMHFKRLLRLRKTDKNIVLLVTERRSGSSFLGELFSMNYDSFYLFEPLLPYTPNCDALEEERVKTLTDMLRCDFTDVSRAFGEAFKVTHYPDSIAQCMNNTLCFLNNNKRLLNGYWQMCHADIKQTSISEISSNFQPDSKTCGFPLKPNILEKLCKAATTVAYKVVRICSLESLEPLYRELTSEGHNVYIVNLVRDPRAVLASRLDVGLDGLKKVTAENEIEELCGRFRKNLEYVERYKRSEKNLEGSALQQDFVSEGRYMMIRFEDFALDSAGIGRDIYKFTGDSLPPEVEFWVEHSQFNSFDIMRIAKQNADILQRMKAKRILGEMVQPFATTRDPKEVLIKWRFKLPFDLVQMTQEKCKDVMEKLGYQSINEKMELLDFTLPLY